MRYKSYAVDAFKLHKADCVFIARNNANSWLANGRFKDLA
jgi:hypothetical protein